MAFPFVNPRKSSQKLIQATWICRKRFAAPVPPREGTWTADRFMQIPCASHGDAHVVADRFLQPLCITGKAQGLQIASYKMKNHFLKTIIASSMLAVLLGCFFALPNIVDTTFT